MSTQSSRVLILLLFLLTAGTAGALNFLEPFDTSSPRATLESFLLINEEASRRYAEYRDSPSRATYDALSKTIAKSGRLLDLSQVPPAARREVAPETRVLLQEIIARVELPDLAEIPDALADKEGDEKPEQPTRWRIPGTEITIARVEEGPRAGEFLFSPDTVERAWSFYETARELPYRRSLSTVNLIEKYRFFTGWMIPPAWVEALPGWTNTLVLGQVLWKWFALLLLFGLALGAVITVFRRGRRGPRDGSLRSYLYRLGAPVLILVLAPLLQHVIAIQINVTGSAAEIPGYLVEIASTLAMVWFIWLTASWTAEAIIASPRISPKSLDAHLIRLAARSIGILATVVFVFRIANDIGIPVYGLVAGAGVGGLAVALAARATLENFMGTLNLYADRPVRVDDFCRYGADSFGAVEQIGLRSTRIRGVDRTLTTIPNAEFSNMHIVNLTKRDCLLLQMKIGLRYETTPDQLRLVLAELREMLLAHPRIDEDPARVRATGFGAYSLDLELFAYVKTADWNDFLAVQEDVILRIMDLVPKAGTGFAFPSQTVYHSRDPGLDDERRQAAEQQVREWAAGQTLPFPDFSYEYRKRIMDTLDYPPEGSPDADRG